MREGREETALASFSLRRLGDLVNWMVFVGIGRAYDDKQRNFELSSAAMVRCALNKVSLVVAEGDWPFRE